MTALFIGYGVATKNFINPPVEFNCCDTYIQKEGIVRDFGVYDDPDSLLREHRQTMNLLKRVRLSTYRQTFDE